LRLIGFDLRHDEALGLEELRGSVKHRRVRDESAIPAEVAALTGRADIVRWEWRA